ncbi:ImmA/IrrE family metallo-endopeptidase [Acinetobacter pittii]|uniref:ImmA/IrrE family metallo-endopeptidase n=1 Tax=Acinetobacter pittii TaxID=48296 RepID=UPI002DBB4957|nr:ImmA/IrrE family metallo-endopeptidase [Acinetobacter pittii]MEB6670614.1 ImmA/IrrE family metallo-endopeptidase [Acinetobacter pittii]
MRNYTNVKIEEMAYSYLVNGSDTQAPIDIENIIIKNGVKIREDSSLGTGVIGQITYSDDVAIISINPSENMYKSRRRFTLAHEFGHYVLHSDGEKREFIDKSETMFRSDFSNDFEIEANHFAACILMPEQSLIDTGMEIVEQFEGKESEYSEDEFIRRMALVFQVSIQSMRYRLKNLEIVD